MRVDSLEHETPVSVFETLLFQAGEFLILDTADLFRIEKTILKLESGDVEILPGGGWNITPMKAGDELEAPWPVAVKAITDATVHVEFCGA
jgi:hypothetical protein